MLAAPRESAADLLLERCLPPSVTAPSEARALAEQAIGALVADATVDEILLLVSELVANAVRHAATELELRIVLLPDAVRIEVADASRYPPVLQPLSLDAPGGRGMRIVDQLATEWGFIVAASGKVVWTELRR